MNVERPTYAERAAKYAETLSKRFQTGILKSMQKKPLWGLYRMEQDDTGNWHKRPYSPRGYPISKSKPEQWTSLDNVLEALAQGRFQVSGIGILLPAPYVLIDLDAKETPIYDKETKKIVSPLALRMMHAVPSYAELSPHNGLHGITEGVPQRGNFKTPSLEMYTNWFSTITTRHIPGTPLDVTNQQQAIQMLEDEFHPPVPARLIQNTVGGAGRMRDLPPEAANDDLLQSLLHGDMSMVGNDQNRADWLLLMKMLHYTGDDIPLVKALFLASPLGQRAKAQPGTREGRRGNTTYLDRTIERIIQNRRNPPMVR